jgi:hypothetical protein
MFVRHVCAVCDLRVLRATRARADDVCPRCGGILATPSLRAGAESASDVAEQLLEDLALNGAYPFPSPAQPSYPFPTPPPSHLREPAAREGSTPF